MEMIIFSVWIEGIQFTVHNKFAFCMDNGYSTLLTIGDSFSLVQMLTDCIVAIKTDGEGMEGR